MRVAGGSGSCSHSVESFLSFLAFLGFLVVGGGESNTVESSFMEAASFLLDLLSGGGDLGSLGDLPALAECRILVRSLHLRRV